MCSGTYRRIFIIEDRVVGACKDYGVDCRVFVKEPVDFLPHEIVGPVAATFPVFNQGNPHGACMPHGVI